MKKIRLLFLALFILPGCVLQTQHRGFIFPEDLETEIAGVRTTAELERKLGKSVAAEECRSAFIADPEKDALHWLNIPVITVLSHGVFTDQFAVELGLREHLINAGYNVGQIGSRELSEFFGFPSMPGFIAEPIDSYEKVLRFNAYAVDLVNKNDYDVLIVGAPGSIMRYNDQTLDGLGITPFVVSCAVRSDIIIVCTNYNEYLRLYFEGIRAFGQYRFETPIEFFSISNTKVEQDMASNVKPRKRVSLDSEFITESIKSKMAYDGFTIFNALSRESAANAYENVIATLAGNVENIH